LKVVSQTDEDFRFVRQVVEWGFRSKINAGFFAVIESEKGFNTGGRREALTRPHVADIVTNTLLPERYAVELSVG
jgi:hypothetical protein